MKLSARRVWIILVGAFIVLMAIAYAPIVLAWSGAKDLSDVAHFPGLVAVEPNAPMKSLSVIYFPLMTFHARLCGYGYVGIHQEALLYARGYVGEPLTK